MTLDQIAIIAAIIASILLVICGVLLYLIKKKKINLDRRQKISFKSKDMNSKNKNKALTQQAEVQKGENNGNHRLDGARVSHRRSHPDRIALEASLKDVKNLEEEKRIRKIDFERKNKLQLVYSPCSGDVTAIAQTLEEAKQCGLTNPGIIIKLSDDKVASPVNGVIKEISEENHQITVESDTGLLVVLKTDPSACDSSSNYWTQLVDRGRNVHVGDILFQVNKDILRNELNPFTISVIISNYKVGQLLLVRRENYISLGDKLITIKEEVV